MTDDSTHDALAAIRGLADLRIAEDEAERAAIPGSPYEQAALALRLLDDRRNPRDDERFVLGLPRGAELSAVHETLAAIAAREPVVVVEGWLTHVTGGGIGLSTAQLVSSAFLQLPTVEPVATKLYEVLTSLDDTIRSRVRQMVVASGKHDVALLDVLRAVLTSDDVHRHCAETALGIAAATGGAALIVARARRDRALRRIQAMSDMPLQWSMHGSRVASSLVLVQAITASRSPLLVATAKLELERCSSPSDREQWAAALLAVDPDAPAYLARMRNRPGWGTVTGTLSPSPEPLGELLSPLADVRRRAVELLARKPRFEHIQAFLLAAELDRHLLPTARTARWRPLEVSRWLPIFTALTDGPESFAVLAHIGRGVSYTVDWVVAVRSRTLLDELLDAGAARLPWPEQQLTDELRDLAERGVDAFAAGFALRPLDATELADLDAQEAEISSRA